MLVYTLFAALTLLLPTANAEEDPTTYSLQELVDQTLSQNGEIDAVQWRVQGARTLLRKARSIPRLRLKSQSGLVPEAEGDVFNPPDDTTGFIRGLGPFNRTELEIAVPIFTFGKLTSLKRAAASGVEVEEASLDDQRLNTILELKEFYYGLLLAQDIDGLVSKLTKEIEAKSEDLEDDDSLPLSSKYKIKLALLQLKAQEREVADKVELARAALKWKAGIAEEAPLALEEKFIAPVKAKVPPLDEVAARGLARRPDWQQLQAGIVARKALVDAAKSAYYPQVFLSGGVRYAWAPGRTDQHNPFVKDEFNFFNGGVFLDVRQALEWGFLGADLDKARAEHLELKAKERSAGQGIRLDIRRAYLAYQRNAANLDDALAARKLSRQWLQLAQDEYEFDPETIEDLVTAFSAWADAEQGYLQAIYDFNLALAKLERAAGGIELNE
jgi:outer membrane protein